MSEMKRKEGLGIIFAFFLGLMVTVFVGVGTYTFYPPPERDAEQLREIAEQMEEVGGSIKESQLTAEEEQLYKALSAQRDEINEAFNKVHQVWIRNSSILLVILATLTMAISLAAAEKLSIISNGLLLGGVFTMVYGIAWSLISEHTIVRFVVIAVALAITIVLGYLRFVRKQSVPAASYVGQVGGDAAWADLEQRISTLEKRINEAAAALGRNSQ